MSRDQRTQLTMAGTAAGLVVGVALLPHIPSNARAARLATVGGILGLLGGGLIGAAALALSSSSGS